MYKYSVSLLPGAVQDLTSIYNYISNELSAPLSAERITTKIRNKCQSLSVFPKESTVKRSLGGKDFRFVHVGKYNIIYTVDDEAYAVDIYAIKYFRTECDAALAGVFLV